MDYTAPCDIWQDVGVTAGLDSFPGFCLILVPLKISKAKRYIRTKIQRPIWNKQKQGSKTNTKWNGITKQTIKQRIIESTEWDMNLNPVVWYVTTKVGEYSP